MPAAAKVTSIDAVERMAAALQAFRDEAGSGLDDLQMEIQRGLQWIHHDRKEYWAGGGPPRLGAGDPSAACNCSRR